MTVESRSSWGGPTVAPGHPTAGPKPLVILHQSFIPHVPCGLSVASERAAMRSMHRYAREKGWGGFSYNRAHFLSGRRYEGRGWGQTGAHTVGQNSSSVGLVVVMDATNHTPTEAVIEAVRDTIAEGIELGFISPQHEVAPHDRFQAKDCPGKFLKESGLLGGSSPDLTGAAVIRTMPTLRKGKGGRGASTLEREAVRELQRRLGMAASLRTGYFGDLTETAVKSYQRARGLLDDGIVGVKTWRALGA